MAFVNASGLKMVIVLVMAGVATVAVAQQDAAAKAEQDVGDSPHPATGVTPKPATPRVSMRNLDAMIEKARVDLATRLGGKPAEVTLAGWLPVQLPARVLRCEVMKGDAGEPAVPGYRIVLVYKARDYTYHSDKQAVMACPRIEAN